MFKVRNEFSFQATMGEEPMKFIGHLIFKSADLNEDGSLHTEADMEQFGVILNKTIPMPTYWTLELLAKALFEQVQPAFERLHGLSLYIEGASHRVVEYSVDDFNSIYVDGIVEASSTIN